MGLLKTQQGCFDVFLGENLKENKGLFLLSLSNSSGKDAPQPWLNIPLNWVLNGTKRLFSAGRRLLQLKGWYGISGGTFTCQTVTQLELKTGLWFERITELCPRYTNKITNLLANALDGYKHESTIKLENC